MRHNHIHLARPKYTHLSRPSRIQPSKPTHTHFSGFKDIPLPVPKQIHLSGHTPSPFEHLSTPEHTQLPRPKHTHIPRYKQIHPARVTHIQIPRKHIRDRYVQAKVLTDFLSHTEPITLYSERTFGESLDALGTTELRYHQTLRFETLYLVFLKQLIGIYRLIAHTAPHLILRIP